jgi:hypothetical protein
LINSESVRTRSVPLRTIIAATAMLTGIVVLGLGYYQEKLLMIYAGVAIILGGAMIEIISGIVGRAGRQGRDHSH